MFSNDITAGNVQLVMSLETESGNEKGYGNYPFAHDACCIIAGKYGN
jgi:hypothetical protein